VPHRKKEKNKKKEADHGLVPEKKNKESKEELAPVPEAGEAEKRGRNSST
jgi:hypothetical protein